LDQIAIVRGDAANQRALRRGQVVPGYTQLYTVQVSAVAQTEVDRGGWAGLVVDGG
jgi:hypothetical protein